MVLLAGWIARARSRRRHVGVPAYLGYTDRALLNSKGWNAHEIPARNRRDTLGCCPGKPWGLPPAFRRAFHYIDHDKVAAAFVKGGRFIEDEGLIVIATAACSAAPRCTTTPTTCFIIMDGEAEFITGGRW